MVLIALSGPTELVNKGHNMNIQHDIADAVASIAGGAAFLRGLALRSAELSEASTSGTLVERMAFAMREQVRKHDACTHDDLLRLGFSDMDIAKHANQARAIAGEIPAELLS